VVGLYLLFVYCVSTTALGFIVLTCVPAFRLPLANLFLFVLGAFAGMFALVNLVLRGILYLGIQVDHKNEGFFVHPLALVGATLGGSGLVWLKLRLVKKSVKGQP
jgi:hypothetical protein